MTGMTIRAATLTDLDAIERLEDCVFDADQLSRRSLRNFVKSPRAALLVADVDKRLVGYALLGLRKDSRVARLYSIAVDPASGRRGIGRALMEACARVARVRGCKSLRLEVRVDNAAAIRLYEAIGFRIFGRYVGYYEDGTGALRFEKHLDRTASP